MKNFKKYLLTIFVLLFVVLIGCGETPNEVKVSEITVSGNQTMLIGESQTLTYEVLPSDAANKEVEWSSSDAAVATVDNAVVTALAAGTVTITVKAKDGDVSNTFVITVEDNKLTAENVKEKLQKLYADYKAASKASVKVSLVNGEETLDTKLSFEIVDGLYKALAFEQKGYQDNAVYVKDGVVYLSANGTKQQYELDDSENDTLVANYGVEALLKQAVSYYSENAFFTSLTLVSDENSVYTFELDITKYNGSVLNVAGKDKVELVVKVAGEEIQSAMLKVTVGSNVNSVAVEYLGFNETISYPSDLSDYE